MSDVLAQRPARETELRAHGCERQIRRQEDWAYGVYQLVRHGVFNVDWARVVFVAAFLCLVALIIPKEWILR